MNGRSNKETKKATNIDTPGGRLRMLRKSRNLKQYQLALQISLLQERKKETRLLTEQTVGLYERGKLQISEKYGRLFADFFGVPFDWLLYGRGFATQEQAAFVKSEDEKCAAIKEDESRRRRIKGIDSTRQAWKTILSAYGDIHGLTLYEIPNNIGTDIDTHIFCISDENGNEHFVQDNGLVDRVKHYVNLELSDLVRRALEN